MYTSVCKYCKKIFKTPFRTVCCLACRQLEQDSVEEIKIYLLEHPGSNAIQIAKALKIPVTTILRYVEEGYLHSEQGKRSL